MTARSRVFYKSFNTGTLWLHICIWKADLYSQRKRLPRNVFGEYGSAFCGLRRIQICMMWKWILHIARSQSVNFVNDWSKTPQKLMWEQRSSPSLAWLMPQVWWWVKSSIADPWYFGVDPIRIWIRGSMPLTNESGFGSGSGSCYFRHWPSLDANKKQIFFKSIFTSYFLKVHCIIFKDKKSKRSHKAVGIKVFLTFFAWW
jgi:hypothetical protein